MPEPSESNRTYSRSDIAGSWGLCSWRIRYDDGRAPTAPFGDNPGGLLVYSADGWMSAAVCRAGRPRFRPDSSPRSLDEKLIADAYRSYFHYSGTYRIEGDRVIHTVHHSLNPNFVGTQQVRRMSLDGAVLTLRGTESIEDVTRHHELVWRRAAAS